MKKTIIIIGVMCTAIIAVAQVSNPKIETYVLNKKYCKIYYKQTFGPPKPMKACIDSATIVNGYFKIDTLLYVQNIKPAKGMFPYVGLYTSYYNLVIKKHNIGTDKDPKYDSIYTLKNSISEKQKTGCYGHITTINAGETVKATITIHKWIVAQNDTLLNSNKQFAQFNEHEVKIPSEYCNKIDR